MKHIDLFSGIGGFALAAERVWPGIEHVFCDNDKFCQAVLKKHWPDAKIYGDIRDFTNTDIVRPQESRAEQQTERDRQDDQTSSNTQSRESGKSPKRKGRQDTCGGDSEVFLLTGGFPCQPFSQAGKRKGTDDNRYLWPEMLRVIREFAPKWVIAENVRGLVTWSEGLVLEQVCLDLEGEGYEVQPIIIPAVAVNAPHRRDRVWFIANRKSVGNGGSSSEKRRIQKRIVEPCEQEGGEIRSESEIGETKKETSNRRERNEWQRNWITVATELCSMDDGLSVELDGLKLTKSGNRREQLKAYGNAIVPQVAEQIMRAIDKILVHKFDKV